MLNEPMQPVVARKALTEIVENGIIAITQHAIKEMANDNIDDDELNEALRLGRIYEPAEFVGRSWRYRVHHTEVTVVVAFHSETKTVVVTAWRRT